MLSARNEGALFPDIVNLASKAIITANATCGQQGPEVSFCSWASDNTELKFSF